MIFFGKKALLNNLDKKISNVNVSKNQLKIISLLQKNNIKFSVKNDDFFMKNYPNINHQYVTFEIIKTKLELDEFLKDKKSSSCLVILDEIHDPGNFGSIIRTCESFGIDGIIYKNKNQVQISDFVIKASQGAINNVNMFVVPNLVNAIEKIKKNGYWIYGTTLSEKSIDLNKIKFEKKSCIIFGNEFKGISKIIAEKSDFLIKIPMKGQTQSLNVAVSVGIVLSRV